MKKGTIQKEKAINKKETTAACLPWWAVMVLAKHNSSAVGSAYITVHTHHCPICDAIMVCRFRECRAQNIICPACSESKNSKNQTSQGGI
ncbi:MAG: hypothetical protein BWY44_00165 [Candidatus Omnitrophica bacterium ADurb.Bin292]|jgi:hypothetical protein|nr:MAG: hypothetical protein BWY44_00165 [Candidatus Omnitrophica bacterium ADurb.Bin292]